MKKIIKKGNYTKQKLIIAVILSILISVVLVSITKNRIWDIAIIFAVIIMFAFLHIIFPIKQIYEFIYKKRYMLAAVLMLYIVIMSYSGSSIGTYAQVIQAEYQEKYYSPILGKNRSIRSDEWGVGTPTSISQGFGDEKYSYYNSKLRGNPTDVLSIVGAPIKDITILGKPFNIGYLLLGPERGLSFAWYGKLIALMLVSFEFYMLISDKKKLISLFGMIITVFSAAVQWWSMLDVILWGMLALVLIDKFMLTKKFSTKVFCTIGLAISAISYVFTFYPAWQIPFAYIYLAVFIWIVWKNRKEFKMNWKDVVLILLAIALVATVGIYYYKNSKETLEIVTNTSYPGERFELGGGGAYVLFSYVYSFLFPYIEIPNPCEFSGMLSIFPIPLIVSIIYILRNRKKEDYAFLIPMILVSLLLSIWTLVPTNSVLAKITMLYMSPGNRVAIPLGLTQIILIIYLISHCKEEDKLIGKKLAVILSVILSTSILSIAIRTDSYHVLGQLKSYICGLIVLVSVYLLFRINVNENKNRIIALLIPIALITGITVHPIQKGISVITEKPVSKEIQKILEEDGENNLWIADNTQFYVSNYLIATGAKVINSTNIYPNFDLYKTVLEEKAEDEDIKSIYYRYAHLNIEIDMNNKLELIHLDSIKLYITTEKLKELGVKYIVSTREDLEKFETEKVDYEQIYAEYGMYIYKLNY